MTSTDVSAVTEKNLKEAYPDFFRLADRFKKAVVQFNYLGSESMDLAASHQDILDHNPSWQNANAVSSEVDNPALILAGQVHKVVLDIDMDAALIPSSTPGHYHLIIDKPMHWETYKNFLIDMAKYGIIQQGFADFSIARGASWIRTPWTQK